MSLRNEIRSSAEAVGEVSRQQSSVLRRSPNIASIGETLRRMNCASLDEGVSLFEDLLLRLRECDN